MNVTQPTAMSADALLNAVSLGAAEETFLSVYVPSDSHGTTPETVRLRVLALLDDLEGRQDPARASAILGERKRMESYLRLLRPGGPGLAIFASAQADVWHALWLPVQPQPHASYGAGAYVLPLIDLQDEFEPLALVRIESDRARLLAISASRIVEAQDVASEVPGKQRRGGWNAYEAKKWERHRDVHIAEHFKKVLRALDGLHARFRFRRLFLSGPPEPQAMFRDILPHDVGALVAGSIPIDTYAADADMLARVLAVNQQAEREEEMKTVESLITRGEKHDGAVIGRAPAIWAMNHHQVRKLVLSIDAPLAGRRCAECGLLEPAEETHCVQCGGGLLDVDLRDEFGRVIVRRGVGVEIVHGPAAAILDAHEGVGALLTIEPH